MKSRPEPRVVKIVRRLGDEEPLESKPLSRVF